MLICPECQSENPKHSQYCQNCEASLTHTNCHNCGATISLSALECNHCQTASGRELNALILCSSQTALKKTDNSWKIAQGYLDSQQRYYLSSKSQQQIASVFPAQSQMVISTQVIDRYPLQKSYLDSSIKEQNNLFTELEQQLVNAEAYSYFNLHCQKIGLPTIALPYLALQNYAPVIPPVYDAWKDQFDTLLLSNRSSWDLLTNLWSYEDTPQEQILWSLNEMLKYWSPLAQIGCASTLLKEDNLRVDEDHFLGFKQLYFDSSERPHLKDLATKWHEWLSKYPNKYDIRLEQVINKAIAQDMMDIQKLREALYALATEQNEQDLKSDMVDDSLAGKHLFNLDRDENTDLFSFEDSEDQPTANITMEIANVTDTSYTDVGSQRDHNEDFFSAKTVTTNQENPSQKITSVQGLYIVCDGMGGHSAGEVASAMAVETLENYFENHWKDEFPDEEIIQEGIYLANQLIYQTNLKNNSSGNGMMGTTLVMALLQDNALAIAHVGDSRIYRVTPTVGLEQLTQDHEVGQREINRGVEPDIAYGRPDAYQLTQALGPRDNKYIKPSIDFLEIEEDCLLLLCSDGLCDNDLLEKHWEIYLKPLISASADLESGLFKLIDFANIYNGHDNITGVLIRIKLQPNLET